MNIAEGLAREIMRVTAIRCQYEAMGEEYGPKTGKPNPIIVGPAVAMMNMSLEAACVAAGSNDVVAVIRAHEDLKSFEK